MRLTSFRWIGITVMALLIHTPSALAIDGERCFGAAGRECGIQSGMGTTSACALGKCLINGGSWEHDECCWKHSYVLKDGKSCVSGGAALGVAEVCNGVWQKAWKRFREGWSWKRSVDFSKRNATGKVVFSEYCATQGARVHRYDTEYCCSKQAKLPSVPDHPDARVCK
jgi:hypothetical protein